MAVFSKLNKLQGQIDSQQHFIDTLLQNRSQAPSNAGNRSGGDRLNAPMAPALCKQEDYEDVKFWTKDEWKKHQTNCRLRNREFAKLDFLTDENGNTVNKSRIAAMSMKA